MSDLSQTSPVSIQCKLPQLKFWNAENHFNGLIFHETSVEIDPKFFSCCLGTGSIFPIDKTEAAVSCAVRFRLILMIDVLMQAEKLWFGLNVAQALGLNKSSLPASAKSQIEKAVDRWRKLHLSTLLQGRKGRLIADEVEIQISKDKSMSDTIASLCSAVWHDDVGILLHVHGQNTIQTTRWIDMIRRHPGKRFVLFVCDIHDLWEPQRLDEFEQLVSFASMVNLPTWLSLRRQSKTQTNQNLAADRPDPNQSVPVVGRKLKESLEKRISNLRKQNIEDLISIQCLSKLREICELPKQRLKKSESNSLTPE
ncbi:MAG: hypothetical protein NT027_09780 [Proteobacteria bacterium]|nr:hypothetical protein [Pseudomonadota bacterium]